MKESKKIKSMIVVSLVLFSLSCAFSPKYLVMNDKEFESQVKRIIVVPVYIHGDVFPDGESDIREYYEISQNYKNILNKYIEEKSNVFNAVATNVFTESNYGFNVKYDDTIVVKPGDVITTIKSIDKVDEDSIFQKGGIEKIQCNYSYDLEEETINTILKNHNADAVYFHYLNIRTTVTGIRKGNMYYTYPSRSLIYNGILYGKNGRVILDNRRDRNRNFDSNTTCTINNEGDIIFIIEKIVPGKLYSDKGYIRLLLFSEMHGYYKSIDYFLIANNIIRIFTDIYLPLDELFTIKEMTNYLTMRDRIFRGL